ncbi:hypothetical protein [Hymenobacter ruber]
MKINTDPIEKPRVNLAELNEVVARLAAADFPGRKEHHVEAQGAALVMQEPRYKEEVPYYLYHRRARLTRFTQAASSLSA